MTSRKLYLSLEEVASQIRILENDIKDGGCNVECIHLLNHYRKVYSEMRDKYVRYNLREIRRLNDPPKL